MEVDLDVEGGDIGCNGVDRCCGYGCLYGYRYRRGGVVYVDHHVTSRGMSMMMSTSPLGGCLSEYEY